MQSAPSRLFTHTELCAIAARWLRFPNSRGGHGCQVAVSEPKTGYLAGEVPDAIGFRVSLPGEGSVVVECKVSRADFLADAKKPHRGASGMGRYRYYLCPEGIVSPADLPDRWGLLVVNRRGTVRAVHGAAATLPVHTGEPTWPIFGDVLNDWAHERNCEREVLLLTSLLSRVGDAEAVNKRVRAADARFTSLVKRFEHQRDELERTRAELWVLQSA